MEDRSDWTNHGRIRRDHASHDCAPATSTRWAADLMPRFSEKVAVVTGAGGGIGAATAYRLAAEGARLALLDLRSSLLEPVVDQVKALGSSVRALTVDQTDREA